MKKLLIAFTLAAAASAPAWADNFSVSGGMGGSGYYGRIEIGNLPPPVVYNPHPVIIGQQRVYVEPVYVRVPEGHRKHWSQHCAYYNACGRPVYFVQDHWYRNTYSPYYAREHRRDWDRGRDVRRGHDHEYDREHGREYGRDERRDGRRHG